jgi:L-rhamnose mutarotase
MKADISTLHKPDLLILRRQFNLLACQFARVDLPPACNLRWPHTMNQRYCLTFDLKNDPKLIAEYCKYHEKIWPEITSSIKAAGIEDMEIYLLGTRMFMILEANENFSFEKKAQADRANPKVREWEELMWKFQQSLPEAAPGDKWLKMKCIFKLEK